MANINEKTGRAGNFINLSGRRFGQLVVLKLARVSGSGKKSYWLCRCDCGTEKTVSKSNLRSGNTKSCGCLRRTFRWLPPDQAARNSVWSDYRARAKKHKLVWELSQGLFDQVTRLACHYCGLPSTNVARYKLSGVFLYTGIDRKDSGLGYTEGNIVPCCKTCNIAKGKMPYEEFLRYIQRLSRHFQVLSRESHATA